MPTKENNLKFFVCTDDKHCVSLQEISEMKILEEDIQNMDYVKYDLSGEITIEIEPPKSFSELKRFISVIHPNLQWMSWWMRRYGSNNWRKIHDLPMVRRKKMKIWRRCDYGKSKNRLPLGM